MIFSLGIKVALSQILIGWAVIYVCYRIALWGLLSLV